MDIITSKQIEWAKNRNIKLIGSQVEYGRQIYTTNLEDNLFQPLHEASRIELLAGDGGELESRKDRVAKIQALHSSSALGINVFDYWRGLSDISNVCEACKLIKSGSELSGEIKFEQKFSIDDRFQFSPNIDVVIYIKGHQQYKAFGIECKFTEAYSSRHHGGLDPKYFENTKSWTHLTNTYEFAKQISPEDDQFNYLHGAQLIKHILGMNREFGHKKYRLLYLWYDALGKPGYKHRKEIEEFKRIVRADGVVFHDITYQELILNLAKQRDEHVEYVAYLTDRYL